jgi:hypothetical protein
MDLIEFAASLPEVPTKKDHRLLIGAAIAVPGIATLGGAAKMLRVAGRSAVGKNATTIAEKLPLTAGLREKVRTVLQQQGQQHGKMAADYIESAESLLNKGVHGKIVGKVIRHAGAYPEGKVNKALGGAGGISHYANFRAGPKNALQKWDGEVVDDILAKPEGLTGPALTAKMTARKKIARAHEKKWDDVYADVEEHVERGHSEAESIRKVLTKPENADYARKLVAHKAENIPYYARIAAVSPGLILAGGGVAATHRKPNANR